MFRWQGTDTRLSEPGWRLSLITVLVRPGCADGHVVLDRSGLTANEDAIRQVYVGPWAMR